MPSGMAFAGRISKFVQQQVRGFAPIGMVEWWNIGKMGLGILQYRVNGKIRLDDKV
jgi:hypothetical protein